MEDELAAFARGHDARGMCVAATTGVAFGGDQHVLAERGQLMAAEWASIRRGLSIRRAAHRPPRRGRKTRGHRPILAPAGGGSSRAASLARALVVVGVGVALARAQRERRAAARAWLARSPSLLAGEPPALGLRRVIVGRLDHAIELLEDAPRGGGGETDERTVHELRKTLKRLRALMRLLRAELGRERFARENAALRDCAQRLAGARDAEVMVGTLDALVRRHPKLTARGAAAGGGVRRLRAELERERERAAAAGLAPDRRRAVIADLRAIRARVLGWELREPRDPTELVAPGIERLYGKGRRRLRRASRRRDIGTMHAWRKSAKDLRYVAETLDRGEGSKRLRRVARRADRLGELLGEEHDLALLARRVRKRRELFAGDRRGRKALLQRIAQRRKRLRRAALREGERLYERKPKAFVHRLRKAL
jgi:CHAD domain-containing protein